MNKIIVTIILIASIVSSKRHDKPTDKCLVLAIGKGTDIGPYQAGAIAGLVESLGNEADYDVVTGVAMGALNARIVSQYSASESKHMHKALRKLFNLIAVNFWHEIAAQPLYESKNYSYIWTALFEPSLYSDNELNSFIDKTFTDQPFEKSVIIGITNLLNGSYASFNETDGQEALLNALKASVSYPGVFPPE